MLGVLPNPLDRAVPGQMMPAFSLKSMTNGRVRSEAIVGHRLVIVFTGRAADRSVRVLLRQLGDAYPTILAQGAIVVAITPVAAETGYEVELGVAVPFPVLRDPASLVHRRFGAVDWSDEAAPALFLTDPMQRVVYRALAGLGQTLPGSALILTMLRLDRLTCPVRRVS